MTVFFKHLEFLDVSRYGLFSYQYFCHKLFRWLVPFFLITALICNLFIAFLSIWYFALLLGQLTFYGTALWQHFTDKPAPHALLRIPLYFTTVNLAILVAWRKYLTGQRMVMWAPSER